MQFRRIVAITPNDDANLTETCDALWVGGAGDVELIAAGDTTPVILKSVGAGSLLPVMAKRVLATNTNAADIYALYIR